MWCSLSPVGVPARGRFPVSARSSYRLVFAPWVFMRGRVHSRSAHGCGHTGSRSRATPWVYRLTGGGTVPARFIFHRRRACDRSTWAGHSSSIQGTRFVTCITLKAVRSRVLFRLPLSPFGRFPGHALTPARFQRFDGAGRTGAWRSKARALTRSPFGAHSRAPAPGVPVVHCSRGGYSFIEHGHGVYVSRSTLPAFIS